MHQELVSVNQGFVTLHLCCSYLFPTFPVPELSIVIHSNQCSNRVVTRSNERIVFYLCLRLFPTFQGCFSPSCLPGPLPCNGTNFRMSAPPTVTWHCGPHTSLAVDEIRQFAQDNYYSCTGRLEKGSKKPNEEYYYILLQLLPFLLVSVPVMTQLVSTDPKHADKALMA